MSHRERLAGGDRRLVGEEESGDTRGRLTLARFLSVEDLSLDLLIDGRYCQLVLTRPYAEPVTPLGRQRDSAAAASRAHVRRRNSGTHCLLRWSFTNKLLPIGFHVNHEFFFPPLDHLRGRSLGNGPCILLRHRGIDRVHAGRWRRCCGALDKRGRGTRKKSSKARGGVEEVIFGSIAGTVGGGTGEGPPVKGPAKHPEGPRGPEGAAGNEASWYTRTMDVASPGRVLEPGEGRGEASSSRRRRHRRTGRDRSDRLHGMYGKCRQITLYTCHEVLVRLRRGRRRREVIQEAWRKRRTVLGHR